MHTAYNLWGSRRSPSSDRGARRGPLSGRFSPLQPNKNGAMTMERRNILTGLGAIAGAAAANVVPPASAASSANAFPAKGALMKAALIHGPEDLRVVKVPVPAPGPDDVVVRVMRYAPYGTDLAIYRSGPG